VADSNNIRNLIYFLYQKNFLILVVGPGEYNIKRNIIQKKPYPHKGNSRYF